VRPHTQEEATVSDQVNNGPQPVDAAAPDAGTASDVLVGIDASPAAADMPATDTGMPTGGARTTASAGGIGATSAGAVTGRAKGMVAEKAPWRRGVGWQTIGAEGLVAVVLGIYIIADPEGARNVVRVFLGALLLVNGVLRILQGFRENPQGLPATPYRLVTGGIGVTVGVVVLAEKISDYIDADAARWILGFGFLAFGLIGLAAAVVTRRAGGLRRGPLITGVLYTVFAVLLFYNLRHESLDPKWFGYAFLLFGAAFLGFAYLIYSREQAGGTAAAAEM
jgi:uncharacterized membrane protein HdeD (DUF308 family)